jgi:hypothetical protein
MRRSAYVLILALIPLLCWGQEAPVQQLKEIGRFGGLDVPQEQMFSNPVDLKVAQDGKIYILDSKDNDIKVFQKDGTFIRCIGREGSGPGEFKRPWTLHLFGDYLYVSDTGNGRIQVLTKGGAYQKSVRVPVEFDQGMAFDNKGNIYLNTLGLRSSKIISAYDQQGNLMREFGDLEGRGIQYYDFTLIKKQIKNGEIPENFKNVLLLITDNSGNLFAVHSAINKLKKYSAKGDLLAQTEIKSKVYKDIYKLFLKQNSEIADNPATFYPLRYISDLAVDKDGRLFVLLNNPSKLIIYVFSNDGKFKKKLIGVNDRVIQICVSEENILFAIGGDSHIIYKFGL